MHYEKPTDAPTTVYYISFRRWSLEPKTKFIVTHRLQVSCDPGQREGEHLSLTSFLSSTLLPCVLSLEHFLEDTFASGPSNPNTHSPRMSGSGDPETRRNLPSFPPTSLFPSPSKSYLVPLSKLSSLLYIEAQTTIAHGKKYCVERDTSELRYGYLLLSLPRLGYPQTSGPP